GKHGRGAGECARGRGTEIRFARKCLAALPPLGAWFAPLRRCRTHDGAVAAAVQAPVSAHQLDVEIVRAGAAGSAPDAARPGADEADRQEIAVLTNVSAPAPSRCAKQVQSYLQVRD